MKRPTSSTGLRVTAEENSAHRNANTRILCVHGGLVKGKMEDLMQDGISKNLERMLDDLKLAGDYCGFMCVNDVAWIRGPGSPWTDTPTLFAKAELDNAITSGKLTAQTMTGTATWTYYVLA